MSLSPQRSIENILSDDVVMDNDATAIISFIFEVIVFLSVMPVIHTLIGSLISFDFFIHYHLFVLHPCFHLIHSVFLQHVI